jgi:PAS domain S-box-containing protein
VGISPGARRLQEHGAGLLREYLLVTLNVEPAALETHAAASDALAILAEQVPSPRLGQDPEALMAGSVEPHVSRDALTLNLPLDAVAHFRVLDETLTAAVALADAGQLLSAPTQPEIRSLRHWICQQVAEQSAGGAATPWDPAPHRAAPPVAPVTLEWDTSAVNNSHRAIVAADDTNSIVAASRAALDILGYRHRDDLVGRRVVSIIPPRYHQAHLAGFTLHLASDRSPLLGRPTNVPVLRSDGTEKMLELLVEAHFLPRGRRVFTAVFTPGTER